jgi:ribosomal protein S18 acetylase RimI-like enzyme
MNKRLFNIRVAEQSDLRSVAEVQSKAVITAYPAVLPPGVFDPEFVAPEKLELEYESLFADLGSDGEILVACDDAQIVGICTYGSDTELAVPGVGYVQRVYVDPDWWNLGIASALVDRALELLSDRGFKQAALQVLENNLKARAFYEKRRWRYDRLVRVKVVGNELRYTKSLTTRAVD